MAKPIFLIQAPLLYPAENRQKVAEKLTEQITDYHVVLVQGLAETFKVSVFYEKDGREIDLDDLKTTVFQALTERCS